LIVSNFSYAGGERSEFAESKYNMMEKGLSWLKNQKIQECREDINIAGMELRGDMFKIVVRNFEVDKTIILSKFNINDLPRQTVLRYLNPMTSSTKSNAIELVSIKKMTEIKLINKLFSKWQEPECSTKIKQYYHDTLNLFDKPSIVDFTVIMSKHPEGEEFGVYVLGGIHYPGQRCEEKISI